MADRRRKRRRRRSQQRRAVIGTAFVLVCALLVIVCVQIFLRSYIRKFDSHRIIQGVSVGNTDVSGLTVEKAKEKVESEVTASMKAGLDLTLEDGRHSEVELSALGISVKDLDKTLKEALDYGRKGSAVQCYKIMKKAEKNENKKKFPVEYQVTEKSAKEALNHAMSQVLHLPENAKVTQDDSGVVIVEQKAGEVLDIKKTVKSINKLLGGDWNGKDASVPAYVEYIDPEVTKEDLKDVTDLLGSFTTFYGSDGSGRAQNIESGAKHIDGAFLKPGEEYSANAAMEPYTEENGFTTAASYEDDKVVESMGGGICQISTTLYNAVLFAELEVTERSPHTMLISYVDRSQDAAIADDVKDLKFKNNQQTPIYIEGILADGCITFNIYGKETRDPGRTLEFVSETTNETMPEGKRFVATEEPAGTFYTTRQAQPEISARLWKVVYQDGEEQSRQIINNSQYVPVKETVAVGTASANPELTEKINQAIQTQDEARILSAVQGDSQAENQEDSQGAVQESNQENNGEQGQ